MKLPINKTTVVGLCVLLAVLAAGAVLSLPVAAFTAYALVVIDTNDTATDFASREMLTMLYGPGSPRLPTALPPRSYQVSCVSRGVVPTW